MQYIPLDVRRSEFSSSVVQTGKHSTAQAFTWEVLGSPQNCCRCCWWFGGFLSDTGILPKQEFAWEKNYYPSCRTCVNLKHVKSWITQTEWLMMTHKPYPCNKLVLHMAEFFVLNVLSLIFANSSWPRTLLEEFASQHKLYLLAFLSKYLWFPSWIFVRLEK